MPYLKNMVMDCGDYGITGFELKRYMNTICYEYHCTVLKAEGIRMPNRVLDQVGFGSPKLKYLDRLHPHCAPGEFMTKLRYNKNGGYKNGKHWY